MRNIFEDAGNVDIGDCYTDHENVIEFEKGSKTATVTFCQGRYITRIKKLAERFPDEVEIISDGKSIVAHIPSKWVKINPSIQREYTDEEREAIAERFRNLRNAEHTKEIDS